MLKQGRNARQPRTQAHSGGDSEIDASPALRDTFPFSKPDGYNVVANEQLQDNLEDQSMLRATLRAEDKRGIRLDRESYYSFRGSRIEPWSSNRNEQDDYDESGHSMTRTPSPFGNDLYSLYENPHAADILRGRLTVHRRELDSDYDEEPRVSSPNNRHYTLNQAPTTYQGNPSYWRFYGDTIEATPSLNRPDTYKSTQGKSIHRRHSGQFHTLSQSERERRMREEDDKLKAQEREMERLEEEREEKERLKGKSFEQLAQVQFENAEAKAFNSSNGHLWRAGYPEGSRARLRARQSFSKLHNKDTISRDSTSGNEARIDNFLACVGKKMTKIPFLKESRDESSKDGEGLDGDALGSGFHFPWARSPSGLYPSSTVEEGTVEEGYLRPTSTVEEGYFYPLQPLIKSFKPVESMAELGESEDEDEYSAPAP